MSHGRRLRLLSPGIIQGAKFQPGRVITVAIADAAARYDDLVSKGCYFYAQAAFAQAKPGDVLKKNWSTQPYVSDFFAINQVGNKATAGPLLVVIGTADDATPPAVIEAQAKKACAAGNSLELRAYPGDHVGMLQTSLADVTTWIKDRFAGKAITGACAG